MSFWFGLSFLDGSHHLLVLVLKCVVTHLDGDCRFGVLSPLMRHVRGAEVEVIFINTTYWCCTGLLYCFLLLRLFRLLAREIVGQVGSARVSWQGDGR